jgi:hypothetical protein
LLELALNLPFSASQVARIYRHEPLAPNYCCYC